jgi:hypothetical protein
MRKKAGTTQRQGDRRDNLFPANWPWRAWFVFHDSLLASVYARSGDLWQALRVDGRHVTGWLQHLDYEGEIPPGGGFESAVKLVPNWATVHARLEQARNLLGRETWEALTSKAARTAQPPRR